MKWMVAPSYQNATIKKVNEEERKALIEEKCPRCGGLGFIVARVENNKYIPIPVDGGVCYQCNGEKIIRKLIKAYTKEEYEKYEASKARAKARIAEKLEKEREERLRKSEENKAAALKEMGYDPENPLIWLVGGGNTYTIKDQLKELGCKFNPAFGWYSTQPVDVPANYGMTNINFNDVYDWFPISCSFSLKSNAKEIADAAIRKLEPESPSEFMGEVKERLRDLHAILEAVHSFDGFYGTTIIYTFKVEENVLVWMTSSYKDIEIGDHLLLTGTVKKHNEYKGVKQTELSRCILKKEN